MKHILSKNCCGSFLGIVGKIGLLFIQHLATLHEWEQEEGGRNESKSFELVTTNEGTSEYVYAKNIGVELS